MMAPAYIAKVLKVVIKVCAPEKSIVPWAWATLATPAKVSATSVGPITCAARSSFCLERGLRQSLGKVGCVAGNHDTASAEHRHLHRLVSVGNMPEISVDGFIRPILLCDGGIAFADGQYHSSHRGRRIAPIGFGAAHRTSFLMPDVLLTDAKGLFSGISGAVRKCFRNSCVNRDRAGCWLPTRDTKAESMVQSTPAIGRVTRPWMSGRPARIRE